MIIESTSAKNTMFNIRQRKCCFILVVQAVVFFILYRIAKYSGYLGYQPVVIQSSIFSASEEDISMQSILRNRVDVHKFDTNNFEHDHKINKMLTTIAIGLALTSRGVHNVTEGNLRYKFLFFRTLLPSFCKTSTQGYSYHFYIAFDANDAFFADSQSFQWFTDVFDLFRRDICGYVTDMHLHLVECPYSQKPAWAQNDAMMEAYLDNMDYYYRVNDDSLLQSPGWTETYISTLLSFSPPNVGVAGPTDTGDKESILTHDFVHRSHLDILGYYYPRVFPSWFADDWMSSIYQPNRTQKVRAVKVMHTMLLGRRYDNNNLGTSQYLKLQVNSDKRQVQQYIQTRALPSTKTKDSSKVVTFALPSTDRNFIYGAIRNIHLIERFLPDWSVHIFLNMDSFSSRILDKLNQTQVKLIQSIKAGIPLQLLPYTVVEDTNIKYFIKRNVLDRLMQRDAEVIQLWLKGDEHFFCMRDHPLFHNAPLIPGLFGAKTEAFTDIFINSHKSVHSYLSSFVNFSQWKNQTIEKLDFSEHYLQYDSYNTSAYPIEYQFLNDYLWPKIREKPRCFDSVHCDYWIENSKVQTFPNERQDYSFVGEKFAAFERTLDVNATVILQSYETKCDE